MSDGTKIKLVLHNKGESISKATLNFKIKGTLYEDKQSQKTITIDLEKEQFTTEGDPKKALKSVLERLEPELMESQIKRLIINALRSSAQGKVEKTLTMQQSEPQLETVQQNT